MKLLRFLGAVLAFAIATPVLAQPGPTNDPSGRAAYDYSRDAQRVTCIDPTTKVVTSCGGGAGTLSAQANAASQSSTEGATTDPLSVDLSRWLRTRAEDCAFVSIGCRSDAAWSGSGNGTAIAILKLLHSDNGSAIPAGSAIIGGVDGAEAQGAAVTGRLTRSGCRASTTLPTAVTDGQAVDPMCTPTGKAIVALFAPETFRQRGAASTTGGSAQAFTNWSTPGTGVSFYILHASCFRTDAGTTMIYATLNDGASTPIPIPAGGAASIDFSAVPLKSAATATAPTFTPSTATTTVFCAAQGYNE